MIKYFPCRKSLKKKLLNEIDENGVLLMGWRLRKATDHLFKQVQDLYDKRKRFLKDLVCTINNYL